VQFIDFAAKFIGESRKIYKSASSASEDHIILDTVAHDIHHLSDSIFVPEGCSDALKQLTDDTKRLNQGLLDMLEKLRVTNYYISYHELLERGKVRTPRPGLRDQGIDFTCHSCDKVERKSKGCAIFVM
jgi:hypothetical protein